MKRATSAEDLKRIEKKMYESGLTGLTTQELANLLGVSKATLRARFKRQGIHPSGQILVGRQYHGVYTMEQIKKIAKPT